MRGPAKSLMVANYVTSSRPLSSRFRQQVRTERNLIKLPAVDIEEPGTVDIEEPGSAYKQVTDTVN